MSGESKIKKLYTSIFRLLIKNQKRLETMGVGRVIEENKAFLREWFPIE